MFSIRVTDFIQGKELKAKEKLSFMLNIMRKHLSKWFLILVVGGIALVFVFLGVFPQAGGISMGSADIANVGGEHISVQELQNTVNREMEAYKSLGGNL